MMRRSFLLSAAVLLFLTFSGTALADVFDGPCRKYGVPKTLALAIAMQESGGNPWAVNVAGKSYQPASKADALSIVRRAQEKSYDIGLMQVNSQWLRRFHISPETAIEPRNNVLLGVWILASSIREHGMNWKAVGAYHSPTPARQQQYARLVARHLKKFYRTK